MKPLLIIILLICCSAVSAQSIKPPQKPLTRETFTKKDTLFVVSSSLYWSSVYADYHTTRGLREINPLMRNAQGGVSKPKYMTMVWAQYGGTLWLDHKHHSKLANFIRFAAAGMHFAAAIHNARQ